MEKLQTTIIECAEHIDKTTNVGLSENQRDIYFLLENLVNEVKAAYPQSPCKDKCSACCVDSGLPRTSAIEWQLIYDYMKNHMAPETRDAVINRTLNMHGGQLDQLLQEQARIQVPHTQREKADMEKPKFKCAECPFLVNHSCTIYPVRPAICRGFGYFSIRVAGKSNIFACQMAADIIGGDLKEKGVKNWMLPVWDKFAERIYQLNGDKAVSILPLWILSHLDEDNKLKPELDRSPDFQALKCER